MAKLLKLQGLQAIQPQSFKPKTTNSRHALGYNPNLLMQTEINQLKMLSFEGQEAGKIQAIEFCDSQSD